MEDVLFTILLAEDDPSDVLLFQRGLEKNHIRNPLQVVEDGEENSLEPRP